MHKWIKHITIFLFLLLLSLSGNSQDNNLSNLSVVVEFNSAPISVDITHTPLKYNKDFALSFTLDDGVKDAYTYAYKFLTGGVVEGNDYDPVYYTDGCGNDINFTMSAAIFSFNNDQGIDVHDPDGNTFLNIYVTWPEIIEMYQNGWGIFNHGLTTSFTGDIDYLIGRNHSYIKSKTQDATPGGIHSTVLVCPNGSTAFISPAFNQGYNAVYRSFSYGIDYLNVFSPSTIIDLDSLKMGRHILTGATSLSAIADDLYSASNSIAETSPWASTFNHSVSGGTGYSFGTFKNHIQYIASTYGKNGLDNIWFTTEEEVLDYVLTRDAINVHTQTIGNNIHITFTGDTPKDLRNYFMSLDISGNTLDTITGITVNGETFSSHSTLNQPQALINIEWDGADMPTAIETATLYIDSTEKTKSQFIANIAMDYVNIVEFGPDRDVLKLRLCNIDGVSMPDEFCAFCETSIGNDTSICIGECVNLSVPEGSSFIWSTGETTQDIFVCPTITTEYSIKVLDADGCEARDTINVVVNPLPIIQTSNDTIVCPNNCVKLWVNGLQ